MGYWEVFFLALDMTLNLSGMLTKGLRAIPLIWLELEVIFHFKNLLSLERLEMKVLFSNPLSSRSLVFPLKIVWTIFFSYSAFVFLSITYHKWLWNANGNFNILPEKSLLSKSTSLLGWCSIFHSATNNIKLSSITQQGSLFFQPPEPIFSLLYQISPLVS